MDLTEQLQTELEEYNSINQQIGELEAQKIHKLGRISMLQEQIQSEKNSPEEESGAS